MIERATLNAAAALVTILAGCEWMDSKTPPPPDRDLSTDADVVIDDVTVSTDGEEEVLDVEEEVVVGECDRVVEEFDPLASRAGYDDMYADAWKVQGTFTPGFYSTPLDIVDIESWRSDGGPWTPGVYVIDHWVHRSYCGLCVFYFEGCTNPDDSHSCARAYNAVEATLDLDLITVSGGGLVLGDLTGVYMVEVDWDTGQRIPEPDDTSFCLDSWFFSESFEPISLW